MQDLAREFNDFAADNRGVEDKEMISTFFSQCCLKEHVQVFDRFLKGVHRAVNAERVEQAREVRETPTTEW